MVFVHAFILCRQKETAAIIHECAATRMGENEVSDSDEWTLMTAVTKWWRRGWFSVQALLKDDPLMNGN